MDKYVETYQRHMEILGKEMRGKRKLIEMDPTNGNLDADCHDMQHIISLVQSKDKSKQKEWDETRNGETEEDCHNEMPREALELHGKSKETGRDETSEGLNRDCHDPVSEDDLESQDTSKQKEWDETKKEEIEEDCHNEMPEAALESQGKSKEIGRDKTSEDFVRDSHDPVSEDDLESQEESEQINCDELYEESDGDCHDQMPGGALELQKEESLTESIANAPLSSPQPIEGDASLPRAMEELVSSPQAIEELVALPQAIEKEEEKSSLQTIEEDTSSISSSCEFSKSTQYLNSIPFELKHYRKRFRKYNGSNYIFSNKACTPVRPSMYYKQDRMNASTREGYCAPFSRAAIRYCMGGDGNGEKHIWGDDEMLTSVATEVERKETEDDEIDKTVSCKKADSSDDSISSESPWHGFDAKMGDDGDEEAEDPVSKTEKFNFNVDHSFDQPKITKSTYANIMEDQMTQYQGNCLLLLPCSCSNCLQGIKQYSPDNDDSSDADSTTTDASQNGMSEEKCHFPNLFLFHPMGQQLSVSPLLLPYGKESIMNLIKSPRLKSSRQSYKYTYTAPKIREIVDSIQRGGKVDLGGKIMQVGGCFDCEKMLTQASVSRNSKKLIIVRTSTHCSVVSCEIMEQRGKYVMNKMNACYGYCSLKEVGRVDLRNERNGSFAPIDMAVNPQEPIPFARFVILSRSLQRSSARDGKTNTLHQVRVSHDSAARIESHAISNVEDISRIIYTSEHPMLLWSAARGPTYNFFYKGKRSQTPMMGYGHSLYSIDLRTNQASFTWSPSHAEYMSEKIYSVNGIFPDSRRAHTVYVSSISAGKMWEIDARMPARTISSWSLPNICEDFGANVTPAGLYGSGMMMTRPLEFPPTLNSREKQPIICMSKNPGSNGLHLYQPAASLPRFQTRNLEISSRPGIVGLPGIASSSFFPHPDSSEGVFSCGLAALYVPTSLLVRGKDTRLPNKSLCTISATSNCDLYTHSLLKYAALSRNESVMFERLPVGTSSVPVPESLCSIPSRNTRMDSKHDLYLQVSNEYPLSSQAILGNYVATRSQCRSFETIHMDEVPKINQNESRKEPYAVIHHPIPAIHLTSDNNNDPKNLSLPMKYLNEVSSALLSNDIDSSPSVLIPNPDEISNTDISEGKINELKGLWNT